MFLQQLGIFGWNEPGENLVLASLLTGDPLLLIGNHGCAKTHVANKVAQAMGRMFLVYDASKAMFEDFGNPAMNSLHPSKRLKRPVKYAAPKPAELRASVSDWTELAER